MSSSERFGYEWNKYSLMDENYEKQFRNWVSPLKENNFNGKAVLDAGCGMGRNSYWSLKWGASSVTAFDLDLRSVEKTKENLAGFGNNVEVVRSSIYDIPWQNKFDLVMSIGVIHHLNDPKRAIGRLVDSLRDGGTLILWVYSYEGNEWIFKYINPIRKKITSKLPLGPVHLLCYFISIPLWLFVKFFKKTTGYFGQLASFKFWNLHSIVFDQLIPDVANYWSRDDLGEMLKEQNLTKVDIHMPPNKCGWVVIAQK